MLLIFYIFFCRLNFVEIMSSQPDQDNRLGTTTILDRTVNVDLVPQKNNSHSLECLVV